MYGRVEASPPDGIHVSLFRLHACELGNSILFFHCLVYATRATIGVGVRSHSDPGINCCNLCCAAQRERFLQDPMRKRTNSAVCLIRLGSSCKQSVSWCFSATVQASPVLDVLACVYVGSSGQCCVPLGIEVLASETLEHGLVARFVAVLMIDACSFQLGRVVELARSFRMQLPLQQGDRDALVERSQVNLFAFGC